MSSKKYILRQKRKNRIRSQISGSSSRPRLSVFRSNRSFFAQLIDDENGVTIASALVKKGNIDGAKESAEGIAKKYTGPCVFDRNGYSYHGRVKEFADAAREKGLDF